LLRIGLQPGTATLPPSGGHPAHLAPPSLADLQVRLPGLELYELIGQGGMGAVYRGRQRDLDRPVAVKVLPEELSADPRFVDRFRREARALARLDHPNIVRVYEAGVADGWCYIVMEWIPGVTLRRAISTRSVDSAAALRIVPQICAALHYAHQQGVVHRDIKPENILLSTGGAVKVTDFGLAKLVDADPQEAQLTATGTRMGTMRYMAPEQFEAREIDHRVDIYALGVVFYELLTGHVPMGNFALPSTCAMVDPRIDQVILRTLQREPAERYQWASDVQSDLADLSRVGQAPLPRSAEPLAFRRGRFWRSRASFAGWPVVCIATGTDPATGQRRLAKGIFALGDMAMGVVAIGGVATGILAIGGVTFGAVSLGGVAVGVLLACGGSAVSSGLSIGGAAIGALAAGGVVIGLIAIGGAGVGHAVTGGLVEGRFIKRPSVGWTPAEPLDGIGRFASLLFSGQLNVSLLIYITGCLLFPLLLATVCAIIGHLQTGHDDAAWGAGASVGRRSGDGRPIAAPPHKPAWESRPFGQIVVLLVMTLAALVLGLWLVRQLRMAL
jgi:hypothetical protein